MIISHKHRFIFSHSRKTAGSSITALLNRHLGPQDIQLGAWPDSIRAGGRFNRKAWLTCLGSPGVMARQARRLYKSRHALTRVDVMNQTIRHHYADVFPGNAHATAAQIRSAFPDEWASYYKFAFVRNPWAHAVSDYYWRLHSRAVSDVSFSEYIARLEDLDRPDPENLRPAVISNWDIYGIGDEIAVDFIGRFETLKEDLATVGGHLGLKLDLNTAASKTGVRKKNRPVSDHYNEATDAAIRRIYAVKLPISTMRCRSREILPYFG